MMGNFRVGIVRQKGIPPADRADDWFIEHHSNDRSREHVNFSFTHRRESVPWKFGRGRDSYFLNIEVTLADQLAGVRGGLLRGRQVNIRCEPGLEERVKGLLMAAPEREPYSVLFAGRLGLVAYSGRSGGGWTTANFDDDIAGELTAQHARISAARRD